MFMTNATNQPEITVAEFSVLLAIRNAANGRTDAGVAVEDAQAHARYDVEEYLPSLVEKGILLRDDNVIKFSEAGSKFLHYPFAG